MNKKLVITYKNQNDEKEMISYLTLNNKMRIKDAEYEIIEKSKKMRKKLGNKKKKKINISFTDYKNVLFDEDSLLKICNDSKSDAIEIETRDDEESEEEIGFYEDNRHGILTQEYEESNYEEESEVESPTISIEEMFDSIEESLSENEKKEEGKSALLIILNEINANYDEKFCCFDIYSCKHKHVIVFIYKGLCNAMLICNTKENYIHIDHKSKTVDFFSVRNCCYGEKLEKKTCDFGGIYEFVKKEELKKIKKINFYE